MWSRIVWLFIMFLLGRHLGIPSSPRYLELADSADYFIAHENWNRAEEKIIQALKLEPANFTNSMLLANLGLVQTHQAKYNDALKSLSLGLNMAPSSTVLLNNRAHVFLMIDSIGEAAKDLDKSLSIDSIQEWSLQTRGFIYLEQEEVDAAQKIFMKLKNNFPDNASALSGLAAVEEMRGNYQNARQYYTEALELNNNDEEARQAYIFLLIKTDNFSEARSEIRKALAINPENPMFYLLRGYLHRLNYRLDEALADKKLAIGKGLDPKYVENFIP